MRIVKYPRTRHVQGSRLQHGDHDLDQIRLSDLVGKHIVIEEKVDGANSGISFTDQLDLRLQSRGHFLQGGPRETQFAMLKQWAQVHSDDLAIVLGDRYIAYGEWLYKKHTVWYDHLPHYWMEFDILDKERSNLDPSKDIVTPDDDLFFLDTASREAVLKGVSYTPVRVLWQGTWTRDMRFEDHISRSHFKSESWVDNLREEVSRQGQDWELVWQHTDQSDGMEGLYIKWEEDGRVKGRYKFVRPDFVSLITGNAVHHENLPSTPNRLAAGINLF